MEIQGCVARLLSPLFTRDLDDAKLPVKDSPGTRKPDDEGALNGESRKNLSRKKVLYPFHS